MGERAGSTQKLGSNPGPSCFEVGVHHHIVLCTKGQISLTFIHWKEHSDDLQTKQNLKCFYLISHAITYCVSKSSHYFQVYIKIAQTLNLISDIWTFLQ